MLTLLFTSMLTLSFNIQLVKASGTVYIRADGSIDPPTAPISTIDKITYTFTDNIYDNIWVERSNIIIDGAGYTVEGTEALGSTGIYLSGVSNVTIKNTNIKHFYYGLRLEDSCNNSISANNVVANNEAGIVLCSSSNNNSISGNNITNNGYGIYLDKSSNNSIAENSITVNNYAGIRLYWSSYNNVSGNNITNNLDGIWLSSSSNNTIFENVFTGCGLYVYDSYGNRVEGNTVNGKPLAYFEDVSDHTIEDAGQVVLVNCDNMRVENLNLSCASDGVQLWNTNNSIIANNNITANNVDGIGLSYSSNNTISGNNITANNWYGILLWYSLNNRVSGNNITANGWYGITDGILLDSCSNNSMYGNNITANNENGISLFDSSNNSIVRNNMLTNGNKGIELYNSSDNSIVENNIVANGYAGILLGNSNNNSIVRNNMLANGDEGIGFVRSSDNIVVGNNIANSNRGIWLYESSNNGVSGNSIVANSYEGIWLSGSSNNTISSNQIANNLFGIFLEGSNNSIYHNNFIGNTQHVKIYMSGYANFWDDGYPSGGNYWSDYTGEDANGDGIGDTPYIIDANNKDHYPLMNPWTPAPPTVVATADVVPNTLSLKSKGKWITAYIQLPKGYDAADINATTILLNGTISPVLDPKYDFVTNSSEYLIDHNNDGILERMVKFNRTEVSQFILERGIKYGNATLTLTGQLVDGTFFEGNDVIQARMQGENAR